jgi:D-beta-D-heptose 7-phosphate kinase/D-beta-D-heptose 1-phosphate adenosyltransferase
MGRFDEESREEISKNVEEGFLRSIASLEKIDAIVISDYAKGMLTSALYHSLLQKSQSLKIPFIIDPRPVHTGFYREATLITPNTEEAREMAQQLTGMIYNGDIPKIGNLLRERLQSTILITRGREGMSLFDEKQTDIPTMAREVFDVTGAGDTVVAGLAVALAHQYSYQEAAYFANYAAGIAVEKPGTYAVSLDDLKNSSKHNP